MFTEMIVRQRHNEQITRRARNALEAMLMINRKRAELTLRDFVSRPTFDEATILGRDKTWPRITIVTPSLNQGQFIEETILSVLNQNYPNLEYIIMDGGSTDKTADIIRKYEKYLSYWTSNADGGQASALAKG